jgi:hypothetical protein
MTMFVMTRDINGYNGFGLPPCEDVFAMKLLAGVPQTVTVPASFQKWLAVFMIEPGDAVWISSTGTGTVPSGAAGASNSELNPPAWYVKAGTVLSFNTADVSDNVGVKFYSIPSSN